MSLTHNVYCAECLSAMASMPDKSVDLVFGSPPYADARRLGGAVKIYRGQEWVDWMVSVYKESLRICNGLVAFVVEGSTRRFEYSGTPVLLAADLIRAGICIRKPPIFHRVGIPGSGGPDFLRNDYEFIICATNGGRLPWSNNLAMGHPPKYRAGGPMSHRTRKDKRVSDRGSKANPIQQYKPPPISNPGNVIHLSAGGGVMGDRLCHENEAPFPERLAEFFIKSFCRPGGIVLDPFCGSGTTICVAKKLGRSGIGIEIRESQCEIIRKRLDRS